MLGGNHLARARVALTHARPGSQIPQISGINRRAAMRSVHRRLGHFAFICIPAVLLAIPIATIAAEGDSKKGDDAKSASAAASTLKSELPKIPDAVRQALQDRK